MRVAWALLALTSVACIRKEAPEEARATVGPTGGRVTSVDGAFVLDVPPGALAAETVVAILTEHGLGPGQVTPSYRVTPDALVFAVPATITFTAPADWTGELVMGRASGEALHGATFHAGDSGARAHLRARVRTLACAGRDCSTTGRRGCADGAWCIRGRSCGYSCATDADCARRPVDCEERDDCLSEGLRCGESHACDRLDYPLSLDFEPVVVEAPDTCGDGTYALFVRADEATCGGARCGEACGACDPTLPGCRPAAGRCDAAGACAPASDAPPACPSEERRPDGWDDPPGSGRVFVVQDIDLAPRTRGFDQDGRCDAAGCAENVLWPFDWVLDRQRWDSWIAGHGTPWLIEIAGLESAYDGEDPSVTIKLYAGFDPTGWPQDDFSPPGACCAFWILEQSLVDRQARARVAGRIRGDVLSSDGPFTFDYVLPARDRPAPELRFERARLWVRLSRDLSTLRYGTAGGALTVRSLATAFDLRCLDTLNPCLETDETPLDAAARHVQPDVDLDVPLDGLDRISLDAQGRRVAACQEGCPDACAEVPAADPSRPWDCALDPRIGDGYSVAVDITGVAGSVIGVWP